MCGRPVKLETTVWIENSGSQRGLNDVLVSALTFLLLLWQITTNVIAKDDTSLIYYKSVVQKSDADISRMKLKGQNACIYVWML